jgi:hypothetical protein
MQMPEHNGQGNEIRNGHTRPPFNWKGAPEKGHSAVLKRICPPTNNSPGDAIAVSLSRFATAAQALPKLSEFSAIFRDQIRIETVSGIWYIADWQQTNWRQSMAVIGVGS